MKYNVGNEVLIKGIIVAVDESKKNSPYWVGVPNGMGYWLSESDITDKTYAQGLADAWELAKQIERMQFVEREKLFGLHGFWEILQKHTPQEALAKIEAYEREGVIKLGDEVVHSCDGYKTKFYVTYLNASQIKGIDKDGNTHYYTLPNRHIKKTGKHIDIESFLKQIGE